MAFVNSSAAGISGVQTDQNVLSNQRVVDMDETVGLLDPEVGPFVHFLMQTGLDKRTCFSTKFEWLEDEQLPRHAALTGTSGTYISDTIATAADIDTLTLADAATYSQFRLNDVWRNQTTGENFSIVSTSTGTTNQVKVYRGLGGTATQGATTQTIVNVGSAFAQGSGLGDLRSVKKVAAYNYTQIFRHAYGITNTTKSEKFYGESEPAYERKKKLLEHKRSLDMTGVNGVRKDAVLTATTSTNYYPDSASTPSFAAGNPITFTGGLVQFISGSPNVVNVSGVSSGAPAQSNIDTWVLDCFRYGNSDSKIMLAGPTFAKALHRISAGASSRIQPQQNPTELKKWGAANIMFYQTVLGDTIPVKIVRTWGDLFGSQAATDLYSLAGSAFILDMDNISMRTLEGRQTRLLSNRQANDQDSLIEEYLTECGFQVRLPKTHGWLYGVSS